MLLNKSFTLMFALVLGTTSIAQDKRAPRELSDNSRKALDKAQNTAGRNNNDQARNAVGQVITIASGVENNELGEADETPIKVIGRLPQKQREEINVIVDEQLERPEVISQPEEVKFWTIFKDIINRPNATVCTGSSHGDPHLKTYDGHKYDLMSVGEFVMSRSTAGHFEVHTRQKSSGPGISMNSAVAMNVNGDTVCIYAQDFPNNSRHPVRVNGEVITSEPKLRDELIKFGARQLGTPVVGDKSKRVKLPHGGMIKMGEKDFEVQWPTGEMVKVRIFGNENRQFMNVTPVVYANQTGAGYEGLMGNANGDPGDDLKLFGSKDSITAISEFYQVDDVLKKKGVKGSMRKAQRNYNKKLAVEFGESWRVSEEQSLFGKFVGSKLLALDHTKFENNYGGLADLDKVEVRKAKKVCEDAGVRNDLLDGCITDIVRTGNVDFAEAAGAVPVPKDLVREMGFTNKLEPIVARDFSTEKIQQFAKEINKETAKVNRQNTIMEISKGMAESKTASPQPMGSRAPKTNSKGSTTKASTAKTNSKTGGSSTSSKQPTKTTTTKAKRN